MYTEEEKKFITYWEEQRRVKKRNAVNFRVGFPVALLLVIAIFINFYSGWYKRATMVANADPSLFIIIFISGVLIVAFYVIFTSYHKWDINEKHYQELLSRKNP